MTTTIQVVNGKVKIVDLNKSKVSDAKAIFKKYPDMDKKSLIGFTLAIIQSAADEPLNSYIRKYSKVDYITKEDAIKEVYGGYRQYIQSINNAFSSIVLYSDNKEIYTGNNKLYNLNKEISKKIKTDISNHTNEKLKDYIVDGTSLNLREQARKEVVMDMEFGFHEKNKKLLDELAEKESHVKELIQDIAVKQLYGGEKGLYQSQLDELSKEVNREVMFGEVPFAL